MAWRPRHKFNNIPTNADNRRFSSKKEAKFYEELKLKKLAGEVAFFLWQVPIHLISGVRYVVDFLVFYVDGNCRFIDVKGMKTAMYKVKKRMVEAEYPIIIEEV